MLTRVSPFVTSLILLKIFPRGPAGRCEGEEAAEGRKCEGGAGNGFGSSVVHDTNLRSVGEQPLSGGAHDSLRVPRPDPPLLPSIIFPLGPPFCGDQCRAERALGAAEFFPGASRQVRRVRKRRREGNARAAQGPASGRESYTIQRTIRWLSRTAVRWGPRFSSSAPPRSPAASFDHFPFGPAILRRPVPS